MRGEEYGVRHLVVEAPTSLLAFLSELVPQARALELINLGSIYLNDERCLLPEKALKPSDRVRAHLEPRRFKIPHDLLARVTDEDVDRLIVDKPAGLPVHALVDNSTENLITALEHARGEKLFVTHRLDVDTTGLVILAKNRAAQTRINWSFQSKSVRRTYLALVEKKIEPGTYVHFMIPTPTAPKSVVNEQIPGSLRCELEVLSCVPATISSGKVTTSELRGWNYEGSITEVFQLEIELVTGRTQQIRAQMASLGAPLLGDKIYGSKISLTDESTGDPAIALWAFRIQTTSDEKILRPS